MKDVIYTTVETSGNDIYNFLKFMKEILYVGEVMFYNHVKF
jgi:hypothetical protein